MRNLLINQKTIYAKNYIGTQDVKDDNDNLTGEKTIVYTAKYPIRTHISGARGSSQIETFGTDVNYDKTIIITKDEFNRYKITENTVFFVDTKDKNAYDYRVVRIAETLNEVVIAIKKV